MPTIRIVADGWQNYTGDFGSVIFEDGVSVESVTMVQANRLAALVAIEIVETGQPAGTAAIAPALQRLDAPVQPALARQTDDEKVVEQKLAALNSSRPPHELMTKDQLEAIGSTEGLKGLRVIGDKWHVKDRKIVNIIREILKAQDNWTARSVELAAERKRAADAAMKDALDRQAAEQEDISRAARVLTDETSDAIGPDGSNVHSSADPTTPAEDKPLVDRSDALKLADEVVSNVPLGPTGPIGSVGVDGSTLDETDPALTVTETAQVPVELEALGQDQGQPEIEKAD